MAKDQRDRTPFELRGRWIALLGRPDEPTDALRDYCSFLTKGLESHGVHLQQRQVSWMSEGSLKAFSRLWLESVSWKHMWVLLQYTALGWSRRGFSFRTLLSLVILRLRGVRCAVIFHDSRGYEGQRIIDRIRKALQEWIMRQS